VSPTFEELASRDNRATKGLRLNFLTPTLLRFNPGGRKGFSKSVRVPEFHVVIKRLRDRINRLATAYCSTELEEFLPFIRLGEYIYVGKNAAFGNGWYRIDWC